MKKVIALPSFERSTKNLNPADRKQLAKSLALFNQFLATGRLPVGLGFKKINHDKYEIRIGIKLRLVIKEEEDAFYLVLLGSHDEIRRYLKDFRTS